jgi:hypothetical protein
MSETPKKPRKGGKRLNPDKARAYLKEYTTNGFNKTQAHRKVSPNTTYRNSHVNANRLHQRIPARIKDEFNLDEITPKYVIGHITKILERTIAKDSDKLKASELLGDFIRIWSDKGVNISTNILSNTDKQALSEALIRLREDKAPTERDTEKGIETPTNEQNKP